jgi:spore germination protein KC
MIKLIRKVVSLFLVILILLTSGCWNRREIQTLTINSAIGAVISFRNKKQ